MFFLGFILGALAGAYTADRIKRVVESVKNSISPK